MDKILLLLKHRENRRLLSEWLANSYNVALADTVQALNEPFDLCILDGLALNGLWAEIQERKKSQEPVLLPFLLIASRQDVGLITRHLWKTVDELILTPIEKVELQARVEILLRARRLSISMKRANDELKKHHEHLEVLIGERTVELKKTNEELRLEIEERKRSEESMRSYQEQLQFLARELLITEDRERRRIAAELHDYATQNLIISSVKLGKLLELVTVNGIDKKVNEIRELIDEAIDQTRSLTFKLGPPLLHELGLGTAVECMLEEFQEEHGILFDLEENESCEPMNEEVRIIIFRALRELLVNIIKHAQARKVKVSLRTEGEQVRISVDDDGVGFDTSKLEAPLGRKSGFGLFSIREQLSLLNGHVDIKSEPNCGTRITIVAPKRGEEIIVPYAST